MTNLFSTFDPSSSVLGVTLAWNWLVCGLPLFLIPDRFWLSPTARTYTFNSLLHTLGSDLKAIFGPLVAPGAIFWCLVYFLLILFCNVMGLLPYVFTPTSHLSMTLGLALPFWLGCMLYSAVYQYNSLFAHLVPVGTPAGLMPIMVLIETVSNIIRPATLAIRLAANMVAGHLLLSLLGGGGESVQGGVLIGLMMGLILLVMLEAAVACIQAYVFCVLNTLYLNELLTPSFNKHHN